MLEKVCSDPPDVYFTLFLELTSAPACMRISTILECPALTAMARAEYPDYIGVTSLR